MTDDDPGHCAICEISLGPDANEPIVTCPSCYQLSHVSCTVTHGCPCRAATDREKLRAWELACADGRKP